ncbi:MAG: hypothetical protein V2I37_00180 [Marinilabiliaceae bacterium]|jgi:hypothetical protein|nr:hypothetical protein [Marinilabiliaceae bacterium]
MDLKATIAIILKDLEDARNILEDLKSYPGVPAIQVELAKAKCRSAGEVINILGELSPLQDGEAEELKDDAVTENDQVADIFTLEDKDANQPEREEKAGLPEDLIDEIIQPLEEKVQEPAAEGKILADRFSKQASINEQLSGKRHEDDSAELRKLKPINNIKDAIGINEKFRFIRELFGGNREVYDITLDKLNSSGSIDDAFNTLSEASQGSGSSEAFDMLIDLVKRKLSNQ